MDAIPEIDVRKLERLYIDCSAELRSIQHVVDYLKAENEHLRHLLEIFVNNGKS